ncbi:RNA 2',3'-cyclic phosphodiesterase [Rugosimonospora acidiphila]|uniref:RNA 2',3'-cyclic phosphodiesterase n=1 Tax=Rugosimonospora acidiphila TaxID=556531 RepID=A0ABP9SM12_9ACTN
MTLSPTRPAVARLFIAIEPPPRVLDHLAEFAAGLGTVRAGVRVTARRLWHVTLAFIGEVPETVLPAAVAALDLAVATVRLPAGPPEPRLAGGGRFGRGRFTILWTGIEGELTPLRRATTRALRRGRLPYDAKPYRPHLTLARPGERVPAEVVGADLAALAGYRGPSWTVGGLVLYRSHLGPNPVYEPLHAAALPTAG